MPAFNLTTDGAEVEDVSITQAGNTITVGGTYILTVKNTGVLPLLMSATVEVDELEVTGVTAAEDETETVSGSGDVEIDFSFTQQASQYETTANSICNGGGQLDAEASGKIKGIVAASSFDEDVRTTLPNASCNLSSGTTQPGGGGGTEPGNGDDGFTEPPNGGGGGGGGGNVPDVDEEMNPSGTEIVNLDAQEGNYDDPFVNTTQTYQLQQNGQQMTGYGTSGEWTWEWQFGDENTRTGWSINGSPSQLNYDWESTGEKQITVTVTHDPSGQVFLRESMPETVVENTGGGGWFSQDEGQLNADDIPSMDTAARRKDNMDNGF